MCEGVGKSGSPTSRWITSGSSQASSMISRMRETGMELAIIEGSATSLPILVSWGRNGLPPLSVDATPGQWCPAVRYGACEVPKPTEAKLPVFYESGSFRLGSGALVKLERDLNSGRRSLTAPASSQY